jgi:hypothetical protein
MDDGTTGVDGLIGDYQTNGITVRWDDTISWMPMIWPCMAIGEPAYSDVDVSTPITIGESFSGNTEWPPDEFSTLDNVTISDVFVSEPIILPIHEIESLTIGDVLTEPIIWQRYGSTNVFPVAKEDRSIAVEYEDRIYSIAEEERVVIIEKD